MTSDQLEAPAAAPVSSGANPVDRHGRRVRMLLWIVGLCLWVLAAFGVYATWRARQAETQRAAEGTVPAVSAADASPGAPEAPGGLQPIVLQPSDSTEPPPTPWDPDGVQDFSLTERSGRTVTKQDLLGRPWAVCFIFTRCLGTCLDITRHMHELQKATDGSDVRLVSISVDPDYDTPEELQKYAEAFGADPDRWLFLTGDKEHIYRLIQHSFKLPVKELTGADRKPGFEVLHSNYILHVNARGVVVKKYTGTDDGEMAKLRRELLKEARSLDEQAPPEKRRSVGAGG